jgi:thiamine-monophosphate kinase
MKLSKLGEFGLIDRIKTEAGTGPGILQGIGDDCAVLELPEGHDLLTTKDLLIENIHFRLDWSNLKKLGRKSVAVNVSDIAAMGGRPRHLYIGLGIPASMPASGIQSFLDGFLEAASEYGATLVGGDTCRSPGHLLVSVTAEGSAPKAEIIRRDGAMSGDAIYVSGTLGDSALALRHLIAGTSPDPFLAERHHNPSARVTLGRALAHQGLATAMIDLSDGLLADLGHILKASALGAHVNKFQIPLSVPFQRALAEDPTLLDLSLTGGEDYELLFTAAPQQENAIRAMANELSIPLTRIGTVNLQTTGLRIRKRAGQTHALQAKGFNHFTSSLQ